MVLPQHTFEHARGPAERSLRRVKTFRFEVQGALSLMAGHTVECCMRSDLA
jgi:hypothetical protein